MRIRGTEACQNYIIQEIQRVYRQQGVDINDKHIEVIVRQMMRKVEVLESGDSRSMPAPNTRTPPSNPRFLTSNSERLER